MEELERLSVASTATDQVPEAPMLKEQVVEEVSGGCGHAWKTTGCTRS